MGQLMFLCYELIISFPAMNYWWYNVLLMVITIYIATIFMAFDSWLGNPERKYLIGRHCNHCNSTNKSVWMIEWRSVKYWVAATAFLDRDLCQIMFWFTLQFPFCRQWACRTGTFLPMSKHYTTIIHTDFHIFPQTRVFWKPSTLTIFTDSRPFTKDLNIFTHFT